MPPSVCPSISLHPSVSTCVSRVSLGVSRRVWAHRPLSVLCFFCPTGSKRQRLFFFFFGDLRLPSPTVFREHRNAALLGRRRRSLMPSTRLNRGLEERKNRETFPLSCFSCSPSSSRTGRESARGRRRGTMVISYQSRRRSFFFSIFFLLSDTD